ncbi:putative methyltransferase [Allosaccharopolyspora coralli]|uniref:Putative methyltransferase n=1 Tax=Allosaccharopolyspora coralli TaxID=2665642 RepID=A0A5Q3QIB0_9PSEU|nr:bis-aminopropyl spermidine synthase family protein [Allosaccharopolyspora coralli]QGK71255.1 putative methyltransferase [Allosaccharopolyspora coralli]
MSTPENPAHSFPSEDPTPGEAVRAMIDSSGAQSGPLRRILALLGEGPITFDALVRESATPRRTVEELLSAAGSAVTTDHGEVRLTDPGFAAQFTRTEPATPSHAADFVRQAVESGPVARAALDHVTATPETVLRRAEWLRDHYDLRGATVVCVGDHDLTSLAVAMVEPSARVLALDLDERVLAHIDTLAAEHDLPVRTLHADFRFGLAPSVRECADLVFTDPPYTPEGVGLFAARSAECLDEQGRMLVAYGYSDRTPALGHAVQQELLRLGFVFEAIVPDFHRYHGAQAIGSASDLLVCRPTSQTRKVLRRTGGIYTHGPQSVESSSGSMDEQSRTALRNLVGHDELSPPGWDRPLRKTAATPIFDLRDDPGPWLLRMLLACNGSSAAFLVPNNHPDIADAAGQTALRELITGKFGIRFHRSTPDSRHAVVLAESTSDGSVHGRLLWRAHGKLGNTWREALVAASGGDLTKRTARARVAESAPVPEDLHVRLIDLPRHRIAAVLHAAG